MNLSITKITNFLGHQNALYQLHKKSDHSFFSAGADGLLVQWELNQPEAGQLIANANQPIYSIASGKRSLLLGLKNGTIHVLNLKDLSEEKQLLIANNPIFCIENYKDHFLIGTQKGVLYLMDDSYKIVLKKQISSQSIRSIRVANDEIIVGSTDNHLYGLNDRFEEIAPCVEHPDTVFSIETYQNYLITGCKDARMRIFDIQTRDLIKTIDAHWYHIKSLHKHPSQPLLLSTSMDKTMRLWNTDTYELLKVIDFEKYEAHTSSVNCGLWLNENTVISCSDDRSIQAFHIEIINT